MEEILAILALLFILLPIIAIVMASSTKSALLKRIEALEKEILLLRTSGVLPQAPAEPAARPRRSSPAETGPPLPVSSAEPVPPYPAEPVILPAEDATIVMPEPAAGVPAGEPVGEAPSPETAEPAASPGMAPPAAGTGGAPSARPRPARRPKAPKPARTNAEWEALLGGRVLNRIGALALIIGIGYFLKYAFDQQWITEGMRTAIGAVLGAGLLVVGARATKKGYAVFSQGLVGAGISVLYLTVFAAFSLYDLGLSQNVAFILMGIVTVLAFQQAFYYNSIAVSILALIGGFLTPMMLSTGNVNAVGLFTYLAILNTGIIAIALAKPSWGSLEPLAMGATYIYFFAWLDEYFTPAQGGTAALFLVVFWALFQAADIYRNLRSRESVSPLTIIIGLVNAGVLLVGLMIIVEDSGRMEPSVAAALVGGFYLGLVALFYRQGRTGGYGVDGRNAVVGTVALLTAISIHPEASLPIYQKSLLFSALGLGLVFWGVKARFQALWLPSLPAFFMAFIFTLATLESGALLTLGPVPLMPNVVAQIGLVVALILAARLTRELGTGLGGIMRPAAEFGWSAVLFCVLTLMTIHIYQYHNLPPEAIANGDAGQFLADLGENNFSRLMTLALVWLAYATAMTWTALRRKSGAILLCGIGALALATTMVVLVGSSYEPIREFTTVLNIRLVAFIALVAATLLIARWVGPVQSRLKLPLKGILQTAAVLFIFELLTVEAADSFGRSVALLSDAFMNSPEGAPYARIDMLRSWEQLVISGLWLLYSAVLMVFGIIRRLRSLRVIAFALFGLTILKIFIYDLSFLDTLYRIFSFIGLGVILLVISFLFQRYRDVIFGTDGEEGAGALETAGEDAAAVAPGGSVPGEEAGHPEA